MTDKTLGDAIVETQQQMQEAYRSGDSAAGDAFKATEAELQAVVTADPSAADRPLERDGH